MFIPPNTTQFLKHAYTQTIALFSIKVQKCTGGISIISMELTFNFHSYRRQSNASYNFIAC